MIRNAFWNIAAGMSGAILTVALPPLLVRFMPLDMFGAWAFCLQVAGYMNILGLGLQAVVSKMAAAANAKNDLRARDTALSTAFLMLFAAGLIGMACMALFSFHLDSFFPAASPGLRLDMQHALLFLGASFAVLLPATAINGLFIGLERNHYYAIPAILTKILVFAVVVYAWFATSTLTGMGVGWLLSTAAGCIILLIFWLQYVPARRLSLRLASRAAAVDLTKDAVGLTVWNIAMMLISGLHLLIVAQVAHQDVGIYAIASTLVLFVVGLMGAFASVITPRAAHLIAQCQYENLGDVARTMSLVVICLGCASSLLLVTWADVLLRLWGGKAFTQTAPAVLAILALAHCIRNLSLVYVMIAVGASLQRHMLLTPLLEGLISVSASVILGFQFGSVGVAAGMLIGAMVGIGLLAWQNILKKVSVTLRFFAIVKPIFLTTLIPLVLTACLTVMETLADVHFSMAVRVLATVCALAFLLPGMNMLLARRNKME